MILPFHPRHLEVFTPHPEAVGLFSKFGAAAVFKDLATRNLCETIISDDGAVILGIMGAVELPGSSCEVFAVPAVVQKQHPIAFAKSVRMSLGLMCRRFKEVRTVGEDTPFFHQWFTWLGFECEGPVQRPEFGDKKMMMWRIINSGN